MSDLRERVIKAVASANVVLYLGEWERIADAVIAELKLEKQTLNREMWAAAPNVHRWVTEWETTND